MLIKLDLFVLDRVFQRAADWIEYLTGRNNFWLAKIFFFLFVCTGTVSGASIFLTRQEMSMRVLGGLVFLVFSTCVLFWQVIWKTYGDREKETGRGFVNPNRESLIHRTVRLTYLVFSIDIFVRICLSSVFAIGNIFISIACLEAFLCSYFNACTPKPPERELKRNLVPQT